MSWSNHFSIKYYDGLEQWRGKNNKHLTRGKIFVKTQAKMLTFKNTFELTKNK